MAFWDRVQVGFSSADESVNFGTRAFASGDDCIYEASTLATIHARDKDALQHSPKPISQMCGTGLAVAIDRTFSFFTRECDSALITASFHETICAITVYNEGKSSCLCLSDFTVVRIDLESGKRAIFPPECLPMKAKASKPLRFTSFGLEIHLLLKSGLIIDMKNTNKEVDFGEEDERKVQASFPVIVDPSDELEGKLLACTDDLNAFVNPYTLLLSDFKYVYGYESGNLHNLMRSEIYGKIRKMEATMDKKYIVCLSASNSLFLLCHDTMVFMRFVTDEHVLDFVLIDTTINDVTSQETIVTTMVFLTETSHLCLYDFKGGDCKFKLEVKKPSFLVSKQMNVEGVMYIEGCGEDIMDQVLIKLVDQMQPEFRLERLLQRGKFEQAAEFANEFRLDQESVLKGEAKWLMGTLSLWNRFPEDTDVKNANFIKMLSILDKIKDVRFVAEVCLKTVAPDLDKTQQLMNYALQRVCEKKDEVEDLQPTVKQVRSLLLSFGTFLNVCGDDITPEKWLTFSTRNLVLMCKEFIFQGKMKEATIICKRHLIQIKNELAPEMAVSLLQQIPITTSSSVIVEWLSCFVPILVNHAQTLPRLVNFVQERTRVLERRDSRNWPKNAMDFVQDCLDVISGLIANNRVGSLEVMAIQQSQSLPHSPINRLETILRNLKAVSALLNNHHIPISYDLYQSGLQDEEGAKNLLIVLFDNVPEHGIRKFIQEFIPSFNMCLFKEKSVIITSYVTSLIERYMSKNNYDVYWEARCISFIECIPVPEDMLTTIEMLVRYANVPWSEKVSHLVDKTLLLKHPRIVNIELEKRRIPQKLILQKYFSNFSDVDTNDVESLIMFIYKKSKVMPSMLEDAKQLVSHDPNLRLQPYDCLVQYALEHGFLDDALDILQNELSQEEIHEVKETVVAIINYKLRTKSKYRPADQVDPYPETVRPAIVKLTSFTGRPPALCSAVHLTAVLDLNTEFCMDHKWNDLFRRDKLEILDKCVDDLIEKEERQENLLLKVTDVSIRLSEPEDLGLIVLAEKSLGVKKFEIALKALRRLCENNRVFDIHCDRISSLLVSSVKHFFNTSPIANKELIEVLARTALLNLIHKDEVSLINNFLRACKIYTTHHVKPSFSSLYTDPIETPSFQLAVATFSHLVRGFCPGEAQVSGNLQEELVAMCQSLPKDLVSLGRIQELYCLLGKNDVEIDAVSLKELKQVTTIVCRNVLMNIFSNPRVPDLRLALSLLQSFPLDQILQWLQYVARHKRDMKFSKNMSLAVNELCSYHSDIISKDPSLSDASRYFSQLNKVSTWSLRAYRYGIPYKEALADTVEEQMRFLNRLITVNNIELTVIENYCKDMGLDVQECYVVFVKHALMSWEPKYSILLTPTGKTDIQFENNIDHLVMKCQSIMTKIHHPEELIKMLLKKDFWDQINTYYYEIFKLILELAVSLSCGKFATYMNSLSFLMTYSRIGPIQEEESNEWFTTNPGVSVLPEIAKYRLPFRSCPFSEKLIQPEISLDTYNKWLTSPPFVLARNISKDRILSFAINNLKNTEPPISSTGWNLHHCKGALLDTIMECVDKMEEIDTAVASLYFVVNSVMPPGIDRVQAAQKCFLKADSWRRQVRNETAATKFAKAEKKYFSVSTQHVLHTNGLGKPEYLDLVTEPTRLITELYNDPAIIHGNTNSTPGINKAVESIMALHELDPVKIILELLTQWLHPEAALQATLSDSIVHSSGESDEHNIMRACYMLLGNKHSAEIEKYLVGQAFPKNQDDTSKSHGVRLRALRILLAISTQDHLERITARDIHTISGHLQVLEFLDELERFGLVYTVSGFDSTRKAVIVETLLQYKQPPAVRLALNICKAYSITEPNLISHILLLMKTLGMASDLENMLCDTATSQADVAVLKECWNSVMTSAILKAERDGGTADIAEAKNVVNLFYSCPDVNFLDIKSLKAFFTKVNNQEILNVLNFVGKYL